MHVILYLLVEKKTEEAPERRLKKIPTPPSAQCCKSLHKVLYEFDRLKTFQSYTAVLYRLEQDVSMETPVMKTGYL